MNDKKLYLLLGLMIGFLFGLVTSIIILII